jgi:cardiolipin synthase
MDLLYSYWTWITFFVDVIILLVVSMHVITTKRDPRSAVAWMAIVWLIPLFGALFYFLFGINRIRRRARRLRKKPRKLTAPADATGDLPDTSIPAMPIEAEHLAPLARLVENVTGLPLLEGNAVTPLRDGDETYPAMIQAIDEAQHTVGLCMYIFDNDDAGQLFVQALGRAVARGVEVRVLIDDVGTHYAWSSILGPLQQANVPTARFLPTWFSSHFKYANLRNHRKILVVDGRIGFTGGINITENHWRSKKPPDPIQDWQFRLEGPVIRRMQEVFVEDWKFATSERLQGPHWFPILEPCGSVLARGVSSGPDEDIEKIRLAMLGALTSARKSVRIVSPYFLPDAGLVSALTIAALRGVQVDILIPTKNDLRLVQWATNAQIWQVLEYGCKVWMTPPPFNHTKLMVVDGVWTMLGSANWDPRSFLLNFEYNVECYDTTLAATLEQSFEADIKRSTRMTLDRLKKRPLWVKVRDGVAWLFTPFL